MLILWMNMVQLLYIGQLKSGDVCLVKDLLEKGAHVNAVVGVLKKTPLHQAAKNDHIYLVYALIEGRANPLLPNKHGRMPRHLANIVVQRGF